jgi:hypothetical protein
MREPKLRSLLGLVVLALFAATAAHVRAAPNAEEPQQLFAPTYRIFATREGLVGRRTANGHQIQPRDHFVALPSWSVLSPKGSDQYRVRITYNGRSVIAPVWDVGPWNTQDDYWSPNRRYGDLPVGVPMAAAAVLDGYNGGRDEQGRRIRSPNGIDIADGTFWDDLQMNRDDWVEVTFLWLGADPGPGAAVTVGALGAPAKPVEAKPVAVEPNAIAIDDGAAGYAPQGEPWSEAACGLGGKHTLTGSTTNPAKASAKATWAPQLPGPGFYELLAYIPECGGAGTSSARYAISHDGAVTEVLVDQQGQAGNWASLGTYHFGGEGNPQPSVTLSDLTGDDGRVVHFDALAWASRTDTAPPDGRVAEIRRKDNGYQITWTGTDAMSGIATYDVQVRLLPKGGWTDWKVGVSDTGAWWGPDEGKQFAFRARAHDWAGNVAPWADAADMDTSQAAQ